MSMDYIYDYVTNAKKRVWLAIWGPLYSATAVNPLEAKENRRLVEYALEKALEGVDVRIITTRTNELNEIIMGFTIVKGMPIRNLGIVEASTMENIYIIDDMAWTKVNGVPVPISIKEAEAKFKEFWNKHRTKTIVSKAKNRVLAAIPQINKDDAHALIEKAANVDIYVITNDKSALISAIERLVRDIDRKLARAKRLAKFKPLINAMPFLIIATLISLPVLVFKIPPLYEFFFVDNKALGFIFIAFYIVTLILSLRAFILYLNPFDRIYSPMSYFSDLVDDIDRELRDAERDFEMVKKALRRLNILEAPVTEEFYVVDDRAWAVRSDDDNKLVETDAISAKRKFMELWRMHEGPWVLRKDAK